MATNTTNATIGVDSMIPQARWTDDYTARICPECGERIPEGDGDPETGEDTTNNYARHYEEQHGSASADEVKST